MKRAVWLWIVVPAVIIGLGASSCQQGKKATSSNFFLNNAYAATPEKPAVPAEPAAKKAPPALLTARGEVTAVDTEKLTFTLKEEGKEVPTVFACSAKVAKTLKVGQSVEVSYNKLPNETYRAISVKKVVKPAPKKTATKGTSAPKKK